MFCWCRVCEVVECGVWLFCCVMVSSRGDDGFLYITMGRQEHLILLRHVALPSSFQHQQTCHKQRGRLGKSSECLFRLFSLTLTARAADNVRVKI